MRRWAFALALVYALLRPDGDAFAAAPFDDPGEAAVRHWSTQLERASNDPRVQAEALGRRAEALQTLGHRQRALLDLERAVSLLAADGVSELKAAVLGAYGQALLRSARYEAAESSLAEALRMAQSLAAERIAAAVLNDQGTLFAISGRNDQALGAFHDAARRSGKLEDGALAARALLNAARLQRTLGKPPEAQRDLEAALVAARSAPDSADKALQLAAIGTAMRELGGAQQPQRGLARSALDESLVLAERMGSARVQAEVLGALADWHAELGEITTALALNERALFQAQRAGSREAEFFAQWRAARLLQRSARTDAALDTFRRALSTLDAVKTDLAFDLWASQESFAERIGPAFLGYADLLLQRAASEPDAQRKREAMREIQHTLEGFKQIELEDYFRDDCVVRYLERARGIEQIAARTAVLYPVPLPQRLELIVSIGADIHQVTVPVGYADIEREARALRVLLEKRTTFQYLPHARALHDWLIRPLEKILTAAQVDTIVLVPDRPLRSIPLGALHDGADFLIARYAIATAPSLTLVEPRPLHLHNATVLASGLTEGVQGFDALPFVASELEALTRLRSGTVLRDQSFTSANLEQELAARAYSIVHVASHAQFEADSRQSFVLTYDGRFTIDRLEERMKLSRFRDQPVELLFLSACDTAAGDERAALGLAGVAVKAGARSALATLWQINDEASSLLVAEFYRQIALPGATKAEALRRAQVAMLKDFRYRHPGYWSPFLVIGNWL
jgi:CHAT domain-containing protein